ncbi:IS3 family transposase [Virgibacillus kekensis]|uniref:IS3 family transposase n=1 Tax=Virgibacillus kekensis TaxID=202261 RepID=A0ABV9DFV7_9BACI
MRALKCEKYYLHKYGTFEELTNAIDEYIHFYILDRYQKRLNDLSPMELKPLKSFLLFPLAT